jgi:hypothetical protein
VSASLRDGARPAFKRIRRMRGYHHGDGTASRKRLRTFYLALGLRQMARPITTLRTARVDDPINLRLCLSISCEAATVRRYIFGMNV